jgi:hypothetical protein
VDKCGGEIRGKISPLQPSLELCSSGGAYCRVLLGYEVLRKATKKDISDLKVRATSGYMVPKIMANKLLCHS